MTHSYRTARPRLTPLAACVALAFAVGATAPVETRAQQKSTRAEPAPLSERLRRTSDGFKQIQRARLEAGWEKARSVAPRPAGTTPVTSCADDGSAGTLREVITNAVDGDVVDLSALTCSTITLTTGGLAINVDNLSIIGPGATALTIDAAGGGTAFDFFGAEYGGYGTLSVTGLTLTNGYYLDAAGGGIWAGNGGSVVLTDSAVTNSTSNGKYASGGGVFADGNVTIVNSTISGNLADSSKYDGVGGGVYANGNVSITNSTISGNTARSNGSYQSDYDPTGAGLGGGVAAGGIVTVSNSTISGNAASYGGGVAAGGIGALTNSTVTLNTASTSNSSGTFGAEGGGVVILSTSPKTGVAPLGVGATDIGSSILFGNSGGGTSYGADLGGSGYAAVSGANALVGSSTLALPPGTLSSNPLLAPLADNGGPTQTHALGAGSPALNAGNNAQGLTTDQRGEGFPRVSGATADIGAFETQAGGGGPDPTPAVALPTMSTWALALMAGLLGLFGWRRRRDEQALR